jgi:hypothetical protein
MQLVACLRSCVAAAVKWSATNTLMEGEGRGAQMPAAVIRLTRRMAARPVSAEYSACQARGRGEEARRAKAAPPPCRQHLPGGRLLLMRPLVNCRYVRLVTAGLGQPSFQLQPSSAPPGGLRGLSEPQAGWEQAHAHGMTGPQAGSLRWASSSQWRRVARTCMQQFFSRATAFLVVQCRLRA